MVRPQATASRVRLQNSGPLYTKGASTDALLKKLKAVQKELAEMEQELIDTASLAPLTKQLIANAIIHHKSDAVRASAACCLADLLRLYAPKAPYTASELKDIFAFFIDRLISQKGGLAKPGSPDYADCFYLLENLSNVKSITLVTDLPGADEMITDVFRGFFDLIRPEITKNVEICMADTLVQLIDECVSLPSDVLEILLSAFTSKAEKANPAAHRLAVEVCSATKDRLQKNIAQYFSEVIVTASSEEGQVEREKGLRTAHGLVVQINRVVPALLLNVVPALEEELRTEDLMVRQIATKTLGQMFAEKTGSDLARKYSSTWREWLGRANDRHTTIRVSWAEAAGPLLVVLRPEQREELNQVVHAKLGDPDEKVRAAMVHTLGTLDYETALHHVEKRVWEETAARCKDRKPAVRAQAFDTLGRIYKLARGELISRDPKASSQFAWIPREVLKTVYVNDKDIAQHVAAAFDRHFLRLAAGTSDDEWAGRLLLVMSQLDEQARKALLRLTNLQKARKPFIAFVQACEAYNGGIIDHDEDAIRRTMASSIALMATQLADLQKAKVDLHAFAKMNDNRAYKLLRICFDETTDLKNMIKARTDVLQRIRDKDAGVADTMEHLLRTACLFIVNRSTIPTLIRRLQDSKDVGDVSMTPAGDVGDETQGTILATSAREAELSAARRDSEYLLRAVAKSCPKILTSHVPELVKALNAEFNHTLAKESLRALAAVALNDPVAVPLERKAIERFSRYVRTGTMLEAKYAGRLISVLSKGRKTGATAGDARGAQLAHTAAEQLAEELTRRLPTSSGERLVADLAALGQIVKHAPEAAADVGDSIVRHLLTGILQKAWPADETVAAGEEEDAPSWVEDEDMSTSLRSKLLSLDLLTKRCMAYANADGVTDVAVPVFRLLFATLTSGEPRSLGASPASKSRMRLQAGICILKMARVDKLEQCIKHEFVSLALMVQDECSNVRTFFLYKLLLFLRKRVLPPRFNAAPFLAAYDPDEENRLMVMNYAQSMYKNIPSEWRMKLLELPFTRFLHLLAHHPDFGRESVEELSDSGKYIDFYLDALANAENVGLLYHLATKLKGVRDTETAAHSDNLYTLSELAQLYIRLRAARENWTIQTYPGKTRLPTDIFRPLPSLEVQKEVYERVFIPEATVAALTERKNHQPAAKRRAAGAKERAARPKPVPKARASKPAAPKRKRKANAASDDEDDAGDSDASDADDAESTLSSEEPESSDTDGEAAEGRGARAKQQKRDAVRKRNELKRQRKAAAAKAGDEKREGSLSSAASASDDDAEGETEQPSKRPKTAGITRARRAAAAA